MAVTAVDATLSETTKTKGIYWSGDSCGIDWTVYVIFRTLLILIQKHNEVAEILK